MNIPITRWEIEIRAGVFLARPTGQVRSPHCIFLELDTTNWWAGNRLGESPGWVCGWFDAPAQAFNSPALWGSCPEIGRATLAVWDTFLPVIKHRPVFGFLSASSFPAVSATRQKVLKALKSCMAKKELSGWRGRRNMRRETPRLKQDNPWSLLYCFDVSFYPLLEMPNCRFFRLFFREIFPENLAGRIGARHPKSVWVCA